MCYFKNSILIQHFGFVIAGLLCYRLPLYVKIVMNFPDQKLMFILINIFWQLQKMVY